MVIENLKKVEDKITAACLRAGRAREDVTLIAVSKTKPESMVEEAYSVGQRDFGENKVQEICRKIEVLPQDIRWHMIGHLQRNKVRQVVGKACMIHSVDSLNLAKTIEKEAAKHDVVANILIEVNVAQEETKFGLSCDEVLPLINEIKDFPHIKVRGLMTIAPFVDDPEDNRGYFHKLRDLSLDIQSKSIDNIDMSVLSMGMTNDYEVAVEEGATMVRVGTGIFGARNYNI